jgi:hypothetical protein
VSREAVIRRAWREHARKLTVDGAGVYRVETPFGNFEFNLCIADRDDNRRTWFVIDCEGVLVHCGPW